MASKILSLLHKSLWFGLKSIGFVLGGLLTLVLVSLIWSQFDEPIDSTTQAWLELPRPQNTSAENGYVQLLALGSGAEKPIEAAQTLLDLQHQDLRSEAHLTPNNKAKREALAAQLDQALPNQLEQLSSCKEDCYRYIKLHLNDIKKLQESEPILWARYQRLLDAPIFVEDWPTSLDYYLPLYFPAQKLSLIQLGLVVAELEDGSPDQAYQTWARHQRFWSKASEGSVSLMTLMMSIRELDRGREILSQILKDHPATLAQARLYAAPALAKPGVLWPVLNHSVVYEYQSPTRMLLQIPRPASLLRIESPSSDAQSPRLADQMASGFLQRNASANLLRQFLQYQVMTPSKMAKQNDVLLTQAAPATNPCSGFGVSWLKNPVGKLLICNGAAPDYEPYYERVSTAEAKLQTLLQRFKAE